MIDPQRQVQPTPTFQDYMEAACLPFLLTANWWTLALLEWCPPARSDKPIDKAYELAVEETREQALFA